MLLSLHFSLTAAHLAPPEMWPVLFPAFYMPSIFTMKPAIWASPPPGAPQGLAKTWKGSPRTQVTRPPCANRQQVGPNLGLHNSSGENMAHRTTPRIACVGHWLQSAWDSCLSLVLAHVAQLRHATKNECGRLQNLREPSQARSLSKKWCSQALVANDDVRLGALLDIILVECNKTCHIYKINKIRWHTSAISGTKHRRINDHNLLYIFEPLISSGSKSPKYKSKSKSKSESLPKSNLNLNQNINVKSKSNSR